MNFRYSYSFLSIDSHAFFFPYDGNEFRITYPIAENSSITQCASWSSDTTFEVIECCQRGPRIICKQKKKPTHQSLFNNVLNACTKSLQATLVGEFKIRFTSAAFEERAPVFFLGFTLVFFTRRPNYFAPFRLFFFFFFTIGQFDLEKKKNTRSCYTHVQPKIVIFYISMEF